MNVRTILLALVFAIAPAFAASACPNCKASIPTGSAETSADLPQGFNYSVYLMLATVFGVGGFVVRMLVKEARRSDAGKRES